MDTKAHPLLGHISNFFDREWRLQKLRQYNGIFSMQVPLAKPGKPFVSISSVDASIELLSKVNRAVWFVAAETERIFTLSFNLHPFCSSGSETSPVSCPIWDTGEKCSNPRMGRLYSFPVRVEVAHLNDWRGPCENASDNE